MTDKELLEKYPWLDYGHVAYMYTAPPLKEELTGVPVLHDMPIGWEKAFGEQMCEEINNALLEAGWNPLDYQICQIKEKFGSLRWYDEGHPDTVKKIINKYENLSMHTCCECGKPAIYYTTSWICPYCEDCLPETARQNNRYKKIE